MTQRKFGGTKSKHVVAALAGLLTVMSLNGAIVGIQLLSGYQRTDTFSEICLVVAGLVVLLTLFDVVKTYVYVRDPDLSRRLIILNDNVGAAFLLPLILWVVLSIPALIYRINKNIG